METKTKITRPVFNEKTLEKLANETATILKKYHSYNTFESCVEDAMKVLKYNHNENGYELAKEFEDYGYNCNSMFVDELDSVSYDASDILKQEIKEWVIANGIKLEHKIGDKMIFDVFRNSTETGEIVALYPETAQYGVWYESSGKPKGTSHYLVNFEKIK